MKIKCVRENLARALNGLSRVVTTSSTLPVLGNILLKTDQGRLKLSATDLEMGVNYWIGASIEEEGEITIPARVFNDYIANNSDEQISVITEEQIVGVVSDHYSTKINGLSAEEFPIIPKISEEVAMEVTVSQLNDAASKTVFAASVSETNPTLAGVLFRTDGNVLKMVATDSYRLAEKTISLEKEVEPVSVIVPTKTMQELNRMLGLAKGNAKIMISENQIMFRMDDMEVVSRLIEGNYPAYESIMPTAYTTKMIVDTKALMNDVKMAIVFSRDTQKIKLSIDKEKNKLITSAKGQSGENVSSKDVEVEGINGEIVFNTKYLSDVLNEIKSSKVILELTDKLKPGLIKPIDDDRYRYIIMPVKD